MSTLPIPVGFGLRRPDTVPTNTTVALEPQKVALLSFFLVFFPLARAQLLSKSPLVLLLQIFAPSHLATAPDPSAWFWTSHGGPEPADPRRPWMDPMVTGGASPGETIADE